MAIDIPLDHLQISIHEWRERNFPQADATQQLLGVVEEVGELAHAHLKQEQGIRGNDQLHEAEARDAVGDTFIYLMGYCSYRGWSIERILQETAEHVLKRDWIADPVEGKSHVKPGSAIDLLREHDGEPSARAIENAQADWIPE